MIELQPGNGKTPTTAIADAARPCSENDRADPPLGDPRSNSCALPAPTQRDYAYPYVTSTGRIISSITSAPTADEKIDEHVRGVLSSHLSPTFISAHEKCFKTTVALDLAISLASGCPFLGRYPVKRKAHSLQETDRSILWNDQEMICRSKGIDPVDIPTAARQFFKIDQDSHADELIMACQQLQADVLIVDPLKDHVDTDNPAQLLMDFGTRCGRIIEQCVRHRILLVILHHSRKAKGHGKAAALTNLSNAAYRIGAHARQWITLAKETENFNAEKRIKVHMRAGGPHRDFTTIFSVHKDNWCPKFSGSDDVVDALIKEDRERGMTLAEIATKYALDKSTVSRRLRG